MRLLDRMPTIRGEQGCGRQRVPHRHCPAEGRLRRSSSSPKLVGMTVRKICDELRLHVMFCPSECFGRCGARDSRRLFLCRPRPFDQVSLSHRLPCLSTGCLSVRVFRRTGNMRSEDLRRIGIEMFWLIQDRATGSLVLWAAAQISVFCKRPRAALNTVNFMQVLRCLRGAEADAFDVAVVRHCVIPSTSYYQSSPASYLTLDANTRTLPSQWHG
jgi:hypothetical protein